MKRLRRKYSTTLQPSAILQVGDIFANHNYVYHTLQDIEFGRISYSQNRPLEVWLSDDNIPVLIDGYHRFVQGILQGEEQFDVVYIQYDEENKEYIDEYNPDVFEFFNQNTEYKGLEDILNESELDDLSKTLEEVVF